MYLLSFGGGRIECVSHRQFQLLEVKMSEAKPSWVGDLD